MNALPTKKPKPAAKPQGLYADRVKVYPMAVHGPVRRAKWIILSCCLALYYLLPWLRWDRGPNAPGQAVLLDIADRRFYLFWIELWPQDIYLLAGLMILAALSLFLVTSLFGRVWCGFTCPQTVWTDLFLQVERWIQGDRNARMKLDAGPLNFEKAWKKTATHAVWIGIAFWTGGAWIMYYADAPTVVRQFWTGQAPSPVYIFTFLFTFTTYLLAGWAREQVCTYMCPWPRFQSSMLDENTLVVSYEGWRGEPRGHGRRGPETAGVLGDCLDCNACVHVCPTGIDIRDGVQLECIGCGLCVDACNSVMQKSGGTPWLITWDTFLGQEAEAKGQKAPMRLLRPRTMVYAAVVLLVAGATLAGLVMRSRLDLTVLHDRAPLFVRLADGSLRNGYTVKLANKTPQAHDFTLSVEGLANAVLSEPESGAESKVALALPVGIDTVGTYRVLVQGESHEPSHPIEFVLTNIKTGEKARYESVFLGPGAR